MWPPIWVFTAADPSCLVVLWTSGLCKSYVHVCCNLRLRNLVSVLGARDCIVRRCSPLALQRLPPLAQGGLDSLQLSTNLLACVTLDTGLPSSSSHHAHLSFGITFVVFHIAYLHSHHTLDWIVSVPGSICGIHSHIQVCPLLV